MASTFKYNVFKPLYYDRFHCIGADCEDNCCSRPWGIHIDKNTYMEYKKAKSPVFRDKVGRYVKRVRGENADEKKYAEFLMSGNGTCPFQTIEGLCEIHRELGEKYLCYTCMVYPRKPSMLIDDLLELSVTMSCPEAVRAALFNEEPMEFTADTLVIEKSDRSMSIFVKPVDGEPKTRYIEYGWQMRDAAIDIMQDRSYPIAGRIFIIGMMLSRLVALHDEGKADEIPASIDVFLQGASGGKLIDVIGDIESDDEIKQKVATILYHVITKRSFREAGLKKKQSVFADLLSRFSQYLGKIGMTPEGSDENELARHFFSLIKKNSDEHWADFLSTKEFVLENYFVNYIFSEMFPLNFLHRGLNPYHHVLILTEQHAFLKVLLCCNFDPDEGFSKAYITRTVSQFAEMGQHSENPLEIADFYKIVGIDGLPYLYQLLL